MCFFGHQCLAPTELRSCSGSWFYKHLVPLGPKTTAVKNRPLLLRELERQALVSGSVVLQDLKSH